MTINFVRLLRTTTSISQYRIDKMNTTMRTGFAAEAY